MMARKIMMVMLIVFATVLPVFAGGAPENQGVLNLYSARHYASDKEIIARFEKEHGIQVNIISGKARELITRLSVERENSIADLLITSDGGALAQAQKEGLLQAIDSTIGDFVPAYMKAPDNSWIAITKRARVFVYDPKRSNPKDFPNYESLAEPSSSITIAVRPSSNAYNVSLIASRIALWGEDASSKWIQGLVDHFARNPQGNDRDQMKLVAAGGADLAISNSYYLGLLIHSEDPAERRVGKALRIHFPNQDSDGTHINISGVGLTRSAPNKALAEKFIAYLLSENAQSIYAEYNYEYPVNPRVSPHPTVVAWGSFRESDLALSQLGVYAQSALDTAAQNGWK